MRGLNRAEICDVNFIEFVKDWSGSADAKPAADQPILLGSALDARSFRELFE
jgi:2-oxoisovalerate dehydrogenase E1 component